MPPRVLTQIEADWLWALLERTEKTKPLLDRARALAGMNAGDKVALTTWAQGVKDITAQFLPNPPRCPGKPANIPPIHWKSFKELMEAFYEKGFRGGLPYAIDGSPVATGGLTYSEFVKTFRNTHRLNPNPDAREVCVLCGGCLGETPEIDHWISKSTFPLLSVSADNLLPACGECNSPRNKGNKPTHSEGVFDDWFHPYLRHPSGTVRPVYNLQTFSITARSTNPADALKVANLDKLLNLSERWTREFKAEYARQQDTLKRRRSVGRAPANQAELEAYVQTVRADLSPTEPNYEVHGARLAAMLEGARLASWEVELGL